MIEITDPPGSIAARLDSLEAKIDRLLALVAPGEAAVVVPASVPAKPVDIEKLREELREKVEDLKRGLEGSPFAKDYMLWIRGVIQDYFGTDEFSAIDLATRLSFMRSPDARRFLGQACFAASAPIQRVVSYMARIEGTGIIDQRTDADTVVRRYTYNPNADWFAQLAEAEAKADQERQGQQERAKSEAGKAGEPA